MCMKCRILLKETRDMKEKMAVFIRKMDNDDQLIAALQQEQQRRQVREST